MSVVPRETVHRGSILVSALLFDRTALGDSAARRRITMCFRPHARLFAIDERWWLLVFAEPIRWIAASCPGLPLTRDPALGLLAGPLRPSERRELEQSGDGLAFSQAGRLTAVRAGRMREIDPADWIDLSDYQVVTPIPISDAPQTARPAADPIPAATRQILGDGVPAPSPDRDQWIRAMSAGAESSSASMPAGPSFVERRRRWLSSLARMARRSGESSPEHALRLRDSPPGWWRRLRHRIEGWLRLRIFQSRLGAALGRRQAAYLRRTFQMFERGDYENALRHAIPLGGEAGEAIRLALSAPRPRASLEIVLRGRSAGTLMLLPDEIFATMREIYGRAARRLEERGRVHEAAFVLAELMNDPQGAVSLLESHGHVRQAAELAEARELTPDLVVRLWMLAGQTGRAIAIAKARDAFFGAVMRLRRKNPGEASALQLLWADTLANAGSYAAAAHVLDGVAGAEALQAALLGRALDAGGAEGAVALARIIERDPARSEEWLARLRALLEDAAEERAPSRNAFVHAIGEAAPSPLVQVAARASYRSLVRDAGLGFVAWDGRFARKLLERASDGALRADRPGSLQTTRRLLSERTPPLAMRFAAGDRGLVACRDAWLLENGRLAVALGDAGVRILTREGRAWAHLDQPADELVVSLSGTRLIGIAHRGSRTRLSRFDVPGRRSEHWCDTELDAFASSFDGLRWLGVQDGRLVVLDATDPRFRSLSSAPFDDGMTAIDVRAIRSSIEVLFAGSRGSEIWRWEDGTLVLRERRAVPLTQTAEAVVLAAKLGRTIGGVLTLSAEPSGDELVTTLAGPSLHVPLGGFTTRATLTTSGDWAIAVLYGDVGATVHIVNMDKARVVAHIDADGASRVSARLCGNVLIISDDLGRITSMSLVDGSVLSTIRLAL